MHVVTINTSAVEKVSKIGTHSATSVSNLNLQRYLPLTALTDVIGASARASLTAWSSWERL